MPLLALHTYEPHTTVCLQPHCEQQATPPCQLCIHMSLTLLSVCSLAVRSGPRLASARATQAT